MSILPIPFFFFFFVHIAADFENKRRQELLAVPNSTLAQTLARLVGANVLYIVAICVALVLPFVAVDLTIRYATALVAGVLFRK
jgi:hypothetical protein